MHQKKRMPGIQETQLYDKITKLQTVIIDNISQLKKNKKYYECKHYSNFKEQCQEFDPSTNYYDKFWKMFLMNEICIVRIGQMKEYLAGYGKKIVQIQSMVEKHQSIVSTRCKKKSRRTAEEIQKTYNCPYPKCYRSYGSDVSLNLHIKIKHNGGSKTDREKAAEMIIEARQKGLPIPQFRINLPPGFIEQYIQNQNNKSIAIGGQSHTSQIQGKVEYQQKIFSENSQKNDNHFIIEDTPNQKDTYKINNLS